MVYVYRPFNRLRITSKMIIYIQISNFDIDPSTTQNDEKKKKYFDVDMNDFKCFTLPLIHISCQLQINICHFSLLSNRLTSG